MAKSFSNTKGSATKGPNLYKMKDNLNTVRLFGPMQPRYLYWIGKVPVECLSFDREEEKFTNKEKDWVKEFYPDLKCTWSYAINCIDLSDNKVKVFNFKKTLLEQIQNTAEDLGDPTSEVDGWDVVFKKSGSGKQGTSYSLQALKCKVRPLTEEELKLIEEAPSIDEALPRPTPDQVKELLENLASKDEDKEENSGDPEELTEHASELVDDIPQ